MILTVPVGADGKVAPGFGKAQTMAVANVEQGEILDWRLHEVGWGVLHDEGPHGSHHARIVRFLKENAVQRVMCMRMGESMRNTIEKMGLELVQVGSMDARKAVIAAAEL